MLRTIGVVLLACACALAGTAAERAQRARLRAVQSWCAALTALSDELRFRAPPLPELLKTAANLAGGRAGSCLLALEAELQKAGDWRAALRHLPEYLPTDGVWELQNAFTVLGEYDLETQLRALTEAHTALQRCMTELQAELAAKGRVYRAAGLSVGLMLALLLW